MHVNKAFAQEIVYTVERIPNEALDGTWRTPSNVNGCAKGSTIVRPMLTLSSSDGPIEGIWVEVSLKLSFTAVNSSNSSLFHSFNSLTIEIVDKEHAQSKSVCCKVGHPRQVIVIVLILSNLKRIIFKRMINKMPVNVHFCELRGRKCTEE